MNHTSSSRTEETNHSAASRYFDFGPVAAYSCRETSEGSTIPPLGLRCDHPGSGVALCNALSQPTIKMRLAIAASAMPPRTDFVFIATLFPEMWFQSIFGGHRSLLLPL